MAEGIARRVTGMWSIPLKICSLVIGLLLLHTPATAQECSSTPVEAGYRDFKYSGGSVTSSPTEAKPESKLWYHDGFWWGILWDSDRLRFRIHRLDLANQCWKNVGPDVDERPRSSADVLSEDDKLYVASRAKLNHSTKSMGPQGARLYRFSYNSQTKSYTVDAGFPVFINDQKTESLVLTKDSTGQLWATWNHAKKVYVNRTLGDDTSWGEPFQLPVQESSTLSDDICSIIAFGGDRIGVLWSHQPDEKMYFAVHKDNRPDQDWEPREVALSDPSLGNVADDHINLSLVCGEDGTLLAVTKSSLDDNLDDPKIFMLKRTLDGAWSHFQVGVTRDKYSRPILLFNSDTDSIYVVAHVNLPPFGIYMKSAHLANPNFPSGVGRPLILHDDDDLVNDPTSTKQCLTNESGLLVLASDSDTKRYLHNYIPFSSDGGNTSPVAQDDAVTTAEDNSVLIDVLANDSDPDGTVDPTSVVLESLPSHGVAELEQASGKVTYTPNPDFSGSDLITYRFRDNRGANSNEALVTIVVSEINDPPLARSDSLTTDNQTSVAFSVLANDADVDHDVKQMIPEVQSEPTKGSVAVNQNNGTVTYTPHDDLVGLDSFTYIITDAAGANSNSAKVSIWINGKPFARDDQITTPGGVPVQVDLLANDSDLDGSLVPATITFNGAPENGAISLDSGNGVLTYTPDAGFYGTETLSYTVRDDDALLSNPATVTIHVVGPPVAVNDSTVTVFGSPVSVPVLANDFDPDGGNIVKSTLRTTFGPAHGSITIDINRGEVNYTPAAGFLGTDLIGYLVDDNDGNTSNEAHIWIRVNRAPVAQDDAVTILEDETVVIKLTENDHDPDGNIDNSTLTLETQPLHGNLEIDPVSGDGLYTPDPHYFGAEQFSYSVRDEDGTKSNVATVSISISSVNDPPVANNDTVQTQEEAPIAIHILANDFDVDDAVEPATIAFQSQPQHGSIVLNSLTGVVTYTPEADFFGTDEFGYRIHDAQNATSEARVLVIVLDDNDAPIAVSDSAETQPGNPVNISVTSNDFDIDSTVDPTSVTLVSSPGNGQVSVNGSNGVVTYTSNSTFSGFDIFEYTVKDGNGQQSNSAQVVVRVVGPPVAVDDSVFVEIGQSKAIDVLANDTDPDGAGLDATSVNRTSGPFNGTASVDPITGFINYAPRSGFDGLDAIRYTVRDVDGFVSNEATVTLFVGSNSPPVANDDAISTDEDRLVQFDVTANDFDSDGQIVVSTVEIQSAPQHGSVVVSSSRVYYTPEPDYHGTDSYSYTVRDNENTRSNVATVSVTIHPVNDAPIAKNDSVFTQEDSPLAIDVISNDIDIDGVVTGSTLAIAASPSHGSVSVDLSAGLITYTPQAQYHGFDQFDYTVADNQGLTSNVATVFVTIVKTNDPPVALDDEAVTDEDVAMDVNVTENDHDPDGTLDLTTLMIVTQPKHGNATVESENGRIRYTPEPDYAGADSVAYRVRDNLNALSETAMLRLTITPVNDPPIAEDDSAVTPANTAVQIAVLENDSDIDGSLDVSSVNVVRAPQNGSFSLSAGVITYISAQGFAGRDSFDYTVADGQGARSNAATVSIQVTSVNLPPVAVDDADTTSKDSPVEIAVLANDSDPDGILDVTSVVIVSPPDHGAVTVNPTTGHVTYIPDPGYAGPDFFTYQVKDDQGLPSNDAEVTLVVIDSGNNATVLTFFAIEDGQVKLSAPDKNYGDKETMKVESPAFRAYLKFDVHDISAPVSRAMLHLHVNSGSSDGGETGGEIYSVSNNYAGSQTPWDEDDLTADNAPELSGQALDALGAVEPNMDVAFNVTPSVTADGIYSFAIDNRSVDLVEYHSREGEVPPVLKIEMSAGHSNLPPSAVDDQAGTLEDNSVAIDILANDHDPDGHVQPSTVVIAEQPSHGALQIDFSSGVVSYQPDTGFVGNDEFSYRVSDDQGSQSNLARVTILVTREDLPPVANDDEAETTANIAVVISVLANDEDDGALDTSTVTIVTSPQHGSVQVNIFSGVITYRPATDFTGTDSFTYTVADDTGLISHAATVTVHVNSAGGSTELRFTALEDAQVKLTDPDKNYGDKTSAKVESGTFSFFLKFQVQGLNGVVENAILRLQVSDGSTAGGPQGGSVYMVSNDYLDTTVPWDEQGLTSANAPEITNPALDTAPAVEPNSLVEFDVSSAMAGDGFYAFAINSDSDNMVRYETKEGTNAPQLLLQVQDGGDNHPPVAADDAATTSEDTPVAINVLSNDHDDDGAIAVASLTLVDNPQDGSATIDANSGVITYTPDHGFSGTDSFTYRVQDDDDAWSNIATVSVEVQAVNEAPVARNDEIAATAGFPIVIDVLANDSDSDGFLDKTSLELVNLPDHGPASVDAANGSITYTAVSDFSGEDSFTYRVRDDEGASSNTATVTISVEAAEDGVFVFEAAEDGQVKVTDPDKNYGDKSSTKVDNGVFRTYLKFRVSGVSGQVTQVRLRLEVGDDESDGSEDGGDLFSVSNNYDGTSTAWDEDDLTAGNAPEVAGAAIAQIGEVLPATVVELALGPVLAGDGTYSFAIVSQSTDMVRYVTKEGAQAPLLIIETGPANGNQPPLARDDHVTTHAGIAAVIDVLGNDEDVDGSLDITSINIVSPVGHGTLQVNPNSGVITYHPDFGYVGADGFGYTVQDDAGAESNEAAVTIDIVAASEPVTLTFQPTDDAQVKLTDPDKNYSDKSSFKSEQSSFRGYLKFAVSGVTGPVERAELRLVVGDGSSDGSEDGGALYRVDNTFRESTSSWTESLLNAGNAPALDEVLASTGAVSPGAHVTFDVTSVVTTNGTYSFAIKNESADLVAYHSKEGDVAPELVVVFLSTSAQEDDEAITLTVQAPQRAADDMPREFALHSNYPNPFNTATTISYALPEQSKVDLAIFNARGQLVRRLAGAVQPAGFRKLTWLGRDESGAEVASGVYFLRMMVADQVFTKRLVLQK